MAKKVLIVEDEKKISEAYSDELTDNGYEVLIANNATKAMKIIAEEIPDLVILDIKLPDMSGADLLKMIKQFNLKLPVLICTAVEPTKYKELFNKWARAVMIKPVDLDLLIIEVRKAMEAIQTSTPSEADVKVRNK